MTRHAGKETARGWRLGIRERLGLEVFGTVANMGPMKAMKHSVLFSLTLGILLSAPQIIHAADADALEAIKKNGGLALPWPGEVDSWEVEFHLRGRDLTDAQLSQAVSLKNILSLNLRDTKITGAGLAHLKGLTKLRRLHLERTQIDDAGIAHLAGLADLEYLNLYGTKVTDKGMEHLASLKKLKQLYIWQTDVTEAGAAKLAKALPDLRIVRGVDLSKIVIAKKEEAMPTNVLKWIPMTAEDKPPKSVPGSFILVYFENKSTQPVKLFWVGYDAKLRQYGEIAPGGTRKQTTYSEASWVVTDKNDKPLGRFLTGYKEAKAIIPGK
tara:strand:- start:38 stop:1015 length:978 start_codon:yes stop_codon:yes gene_type:complete